MAKVEKGWSEDAEATDYEEVASVDWEWESWQFNMTRVYQQTSTGALFYAEDSGCSCPSPFEDTQESDLRPIKRMQDWYDHVSARMVAEEPGEEYQYPRPTPAKSIDEAHRAGSRIFALLRASK